MEDHYALSDLEFERHFADLTFDPGLFNHEAHLRLAWIHVTRYGVSQALHNLCDQVARFDQHFGDGTKFNKTLTIASVKAIHHFVNRSNAKDFPGFLKEFPKLKYNFKSLLAQHYSMDVFNSEKAKSNYIKPDLIPF